MPLTPLTVALSEVGSRRSPNIGSTSRPLMLELSLSRRSKTRTAFPSARRRRSRLAPRCPLAPVRRIMRSVQLLTLKVYRLNLLLETGAGRYRTREVGFAQDKDLDLLAGGGAGGVARLVGDERAL